MLKAFRKCFTCDLYARGEINLSLKSIIRKLVFDAGYRVVVYYRISLFLKSCKFPKRLSNLISALIRVRLCRIPGVEFRTRDVIGEGLRMFHPHNIVLGAGCKIGKNVTIYNGVTLGARTIKSEDNEKDTDRRYPTIEDDVILFAGAKVIGPITIGKGSIVGANSVVNKSFPANSDIAGVPAVIIGDRK